MVASRAAEKSLVADLTMILRLAKQKWQSRNEVHLWSIDLTRHENRTQYYHQLLSPDEAERADRFYFEKHRMRFTRARATMRQILSRYVGVPPAELAFSYGAAGKPELSGDSEKSGIRFNLSHSGELALLAVTQKLAVGVDVELVDAKITGEDIAVRFFAAGEASRLRAMPPAERADGFFACWTRKEAYIKALGEGLSVPLDSFEVAFGPGIPASLLRVDVDPTQVRLWSMYDIEMAEGYRAALVVEGRGHRLRQLQWE
jgi:4'-phosphopantetheinyl transferase